MGKLFTTLVCISLSMGCGNANQQPGHKEDTAVIDSTATGVSGDWSNPTEIFTGTANDARIRFEHLNFTQYRLTIALETAEGNLNTERGFGDDEDATLYILEAPGSHETLWHFVRMTNGDILMLDQNRNVLPDTEFEREL